MPEALVAIGSNVGDRLAHLRSAVSHLSSRVRVLAASRVYETAPMYVEDQPAFFNAALRVETGLSPSRLLAALKEVEAEIGRKTGRRYGPREIDLDLAAYGRLRYLYTDLGRTVLEVPHPRIPERRFVLAPLADVAPDWDLPGLGRVSTLLARTESQAGQVQEVEDAVLPV